MIIGGVKHYSEYTDPITCRAVYQKPHLTVFPISFMIKVPGDGFPARLEEEESFSC